MITFLFASILGFLFFAISIETIRARRSNLISLGTGKQGEISAIVSAHSNFSSYAPILIVFLYFLEVSNVYPDWLLYVLGAAFCIGRLLHYVAFRGVKMLFKYRVTGMMMTLIPLMIMSVLLLITFLK